MGERTGFSSAIDGEHRVGKLRSLVRRAKTQARAFGTNLRCPNVFDLGSRERIGSVFLAPADMEQVDRILLYALVRSLRPDRVLEIGIRYGGGARIIASALADNEQGCAVGIDPLPQGFSVPMKHLHGRYQRIEGYSPEVTPEAVRKLGGSLDLVLIDALHTGDAVYADFMGVLPHLADGAHVLFHDAYHQGIASAIDQIVEEQPGFHDLGMLSRRPQMYHPVCYQGLRILRMGKTTDAKAHIEGAYQAVGQTPPPFHPVFRNFDDFANGIGKGADLKEVAKVLADTPMR